MSDSDVLFVSKPSLRRAFFFAVLYAVVLSFGRVRLGDAPPLDQVWNVLLVALLAALAIAHLNQRCSSYTITKDEVSVRAGIVRRGLIVVPVKSITNVAAYQSTLERILGLVNILVDCAGGDHEEVKFIRIGKSEAQAAGKILKDFIRNRAPAASTNRVEQQTAAAVN